MLIPRKFQIFTTGKPQNIKETNIIITFDLSFYCTAHFDQNKLGIDQAKAKNLTKTILS